MATKAYEANFDGIVGTTHCYAGLSYGNTASMGNRKAVSNPREAVRQGLIKAKALHDMGMKQGLFAPQERPDVRALKRLGFGGADAEILAKAHKVAPELLAACASASSMWTANAATVSPSADSADGRVHFTAANLNQKLHRAIEHRTTTALLQAMFPDKKYFAHHLALPLSDTMGDEGAANHTRFCAEYGGAGVQLFIYGREALLESPEAIKSKVFPARHTREASEAIARLHQVRASAFGQQDPRCIDSGAFHNDVVSVGNQNVLFYHEHAFIKSAELMRSLKANLRSTCDVEFIPVMVRDSEVPLSDAVKSYLFNSQLITLKPGHMVLVAPGECEATPSVARYLKGLLSESATPIKEVRYFDLRQSMRNGGGPACLRLRVVLTEDELKHMNSHVMLNEKNYRALLAWAEKHYRDRLVPDDLADSALLVESRTALDELTQILHLGSVYPFQQN
jgi:succinylarginine dihydrolase